MEWSESKFGQDVDKKVKQLNFPNTLVILSELKGHEDNLKAFSSIGETTWTFIQGQEKFDTEDNYRVLYCVKINNEEHKELALEIFKEYIHGYYARYYRGVEVVEAYHKELE